MQELRLISRLLRKVADDIDKGNCSMSHEELMGVAELMREMASDDAKLRTADQVCTQIGICRKTLYNWVRDGLMPKGRKIRGSSAEFWRQDEIDEAIRRQKENFSK